MIFTIDNVEYTYTAYVNGVIVTAYSGSDPQNIVIPGTIIYEGTIYDVVPSHADAPTIKDKYIYQITAPNKVALISMPTTYMSTFRDYNIPPTITYNGIVYMVDKLNIYDNSTRSSFLNTRYNYMESISINSTKIIPTHSLANNMLNNLEAIMLNTIEYIYSDNLESITGRKLTVKLLSMPQIKDISGTSLCNINVEYLYIGGNYNNNIFYFNQMNGLTFRFSLSFNTLKTIFRHPSTTGWPASIFGIPVIPYNPIISSPIHVPGQNPTYTFDSINNRFLVNKFGSIVFDFTMSYPEVDTYEWFIGDPANHTISRSTGVTSKRYQIDIMSATYACQYYSVAIKKYYKLEESQLLGGSQTPYNNIKLYCKITGADGVVRYTTNNPNIIMIDGNIQPISNLYYKIETPTLAKVVGVEGSPIEITIPEKVTINNIQYYVKLIDSGVFQDKTALTTLNIPYIEEIGASTFYGCTNLEIINQTGLLTTIGTLAFQGTKLPVIIQHPLSQTALKGSTVTLRVVAQSSYNSEQNYTDYSFMWLDSTGNEISDSADIEGAHTDTLVIRNIQANATYYPKIVGPFGIPFPTTTNANAYPSTPTTITVIDPATATPEQLKAAFESGNIKTTAFPITISGRTYETFAAKPDTNNNIVVDLIADATGTKPSKVKIISVPQSVSRVAIGVPSVEYVNSNPVLSLQVNLFNKNGKDLHDFNTSPIKFQVAFPAAFTAPSLEVKTLDEQGVQQDAATAIRIDQSTNTYEVTLKHFSEQQFSQSLSTNKVLGQFKINNVDCLTLTEFTLPASAISLDVSATLQDSNASYEVSGNISSNGQWPRTIDLIVTAQDKSTQIYSRIVNRQLAPVTINTPPPSQLTAYVGDALTLDVAATSTLSLSYIWQKGASTLSIDQNSSITLQNITEDSAGTYKVIPYNSQESYDVSASTVLTVLPASQDTRLQSATINGVNVLQQSYSVIVPYSTSPENVSISIQTRNQDVQYIIVKPENFTVGNNTIDVQVTGSDEITQTIYSFTIMMEATPTPPPPGPVAPLTKPNIAPLIKSALLGTRVVFSLTTQYPGQVQYSWKKDSAEVSTASQLVFNTVQLANAGSYTLTVIDSTQQSTSDPVTLTVFQSEQENQPQTQGVFEAGEMPETPIQVLIYAADFDVATKPVTSSSITFQPIDDGYLTVKPKNIQLSQLPSQVKKISMAIGGLVDTPSFKSLTLHITPLDQNNTKLSDFTQTPVKLTLELPPEFTAEQLEVRVWDFTNEQPLPVQTSTATRKPNTQTNEYEVLLTHFSGYEFYQPESVPCFPAGTKVQTAAGPKAVEDLNPASDRIVTHDSREVQFKLYKTHIACTTKSTAPYLLPADSLGKNVPQNDLLLSPLHAIQLRPGLWHIPKYAALSNKQITQPIIGAPTTYYHIELPNYFTDNIIAEDTVVESFGATQIKGLQTVYKYNSMLQGFTRVSKIFSKHQVQK